MVVTSKHEFIYVNKRKRDTAAIAKGSEVADKEDKIEHGKRGNR